MAELKLDFRLPAVVPDSLPILPLRKGVLLPGAVNLFTVGRSRSRAAVSAARDRWILVASQREPIEDASPSDLITTATLAKVLDVQRSGPNHQAVLVQGLQRVVLTGTVATEPYLEGSFSRIVEVWPEGVEPEALLKSLREAAEKAAVLMGGGSDNRLSGMLRNLRDPILLVDGLASAIDAKEEWKREILTSGDPLLRAKRVLEQLLHISAVQDAQRSIRDRIETETKDVHRENVLRRQLKAIQDELGDGGSNDELESLKERLKNAKLTAEAREVVDRELKRLERMNGQGPERSVAIDWLERVADLPWGIHTAIEPDLTALEAELDRTHFGLGEVKRQVVEHLAVRKLSGDGRADILLLVGPPGVGKTSIGQAIADATGRKLVRVALGGVRDEAELRGHRRTYIGSRPGRLIEGLRRAGAADPVVLFDEIDKLSNGMQGNPAAALLEILDPEQNHAFTDHYLELPFDLSKVLFIATANDLSSIPGPLRDRMEVLEIAGYTADEKVTIAKGHLLEKLGKNVGLEVDQVVFEDAALKDAILGWTREAGVRQLQRTLGRVFRAAAVKKAKGELSQPLSVDVDSLPTYLGKRRFFEETREIVRQPGIATGLAWTPVGGDVLYVEASTLPGNGQLVLTGQLGDVMKESARAALTYVMSHASELGISETALAGKDVHLHVPAGGTPKDGPSAGVTMFTALASLLTGRPVRADVAMTGEATLRGRVLPVGGIKSKVLAAHRHGVKRVILPRRNGIDLEDVPAEARDALEVILVDEMVEVLNAALEAV